MLRKAQSHRKRHAPPGPCGIWFQTQQQLSKPGFSSDSASRNGRSASRSSAGRHSRDADDGHGPIVEDMSFAPAWTLMQQEMDLVTPYLPPTLKTPSERYRQIRPHMPSKFALLAEIQNGDYDFCFPVGESEARVSEKSLLVFVASVESHIHHNIWTVELQDESGSSMKAWIEPSLVQHQLQQSQEATIIRPGVVWLMSQIGMILVPPPPEDEERLERMLLIRRSAIVKVWTPQQVKEEYDPEVDSPSRQKQFIEWMERRKALPLIDQDELLANAPEDQQEEHNAHEETVGVTEAALGTEIDLDHGRLLSTHNENVTTGGIANDNGYTASQMSETRFLRRSDEGGPSTTTQPSQHSGWTRLSLNDVAASPHEDKTNQPQSNKTPPAQKKSAEEPSVPRLTQTQPENPSQQNGPPTATATAPSQLTKDRQRKGKDSRTTAKDVARPSSTQPRPKKSHPNFWKITAGPRFIEADNDDDNDSQDAIEVYIQNKRTRISEHNAEGSLTNSTVETSSSEDELNGFPTKKATCTFFSAPKLKPIRWIGIEEAGDVHLDDDDDDDDW